MPSRNPTIVVPYSEECSHGGCQDIFLYLRPESNGIKVESALMRGLSSGSHSKHIELAYLANLPGDFLKEKSVIEYHYRVNVLFARYGKKIFTNYMKKEFEKYFNVSVDDAVVYGAFEALGELGMSDEELFNVWVSEKDMLLLNGQTIKKMGDFFVVNTDIPAILHKNNNNTDIAVMIFRTDYSGKEFYQVILKMTDILIEEEILDSRSKFSHVFHYSKGPFEQILDAVGFLYDSSGEHLPLEKVRFYRYLKDKGFEPEEIEHIIKDPIFLFPLNSDGYEENTIFEKTRNAGYQDALEVVKKARAQVLLNIYDRL